MRILSVITIGTEDVIESIQSSRTLLNRINAITGQLQYDRVGEHMDEYLREHPEWLLNAEITRTPLGYTLGTPDFEIRSYDVDHIPRKENGRIYGFPSCCIDWFENVWVKRDLYLSGQLPTDMPLLGTGYLPCPKCRTKTAEELSAIIAENRLTPETFPSDTDTDAFVLAQWLPTVNEPVGENIAAIVADYPPLKHSLLED
jgi:hypothetical protein